MNALLRLVGWLLAVALVVLPVVAVVNGWAGAGQWPLSKLRVTGEFERVDGALLQKTLMPYARRGFFAVDLEAARNAVAELPWVESADVRKRWPDVLEVRVTEHHPFARWGDGHLLSDQGRLFPATGVQVPNGLPQLAGPESRVPEVVALYNESRELFAPIGFNVEALRIDARGSVSLDLQDRGRTAEIAAGTQVVVGRSEARARLKRFVRLMPQLLAQQEKVLTRADLRYTNGFALSWAPAPEPDPAAIAPIDSVSPTAPEVPGGSTMQQGQT